MSQEQLFEKKMLNSQTKDLELIEQVKTGRKFTHYDELTDKYKELLSGILFQFADSELAGALGYTAFVNKGPLLGDQINLANIIAEKMQAAAKAYEILASFGLNIEKYILSHSFDSRILRDADLGFRRSVADKRLNALLYPLENWSDLSIFTYLMSTMACLILEDFSISSFIPLSAMAKSCLSIEERHQSFGLAQIKSLSRSQYQKKVLELSLSYWLPRVRLSFGSEESVRNELLRKFALKHSCNSELAKKWFDIIQTSVSQFSLELSPIYK